MLTRHTLALATLLGLSLLSNLTMYGIARNARGRLDLVTSTPVDLRLVPGEMAPPLTAKTLEGRDVTISVPNANRSTVLYVFSPDCKWCERNHNSLTKLISEASDRFKFVALSTQRQNLPTYLNEHPTPAELEVFMEPSSAAVQSYGLGATPTTIIIDTKGRVQGVWKGAYTGTTRKEINRAFNVELPELSPPLQSIS
jgi:peroxiredoxin